MDFFFKLTELKAFADKLNFAKMKTSDFDRVENMMGEKKRKCWIPVFSPLPTIFSKVLFPRFVNR